MLKIFWGRAPRPPPTIYVMGPAFCICPGPLPSSRQPWYILYFSVYNREYQGLHLTVTVNFIPKCVVWYIMMCIEKFNCIFVCHIRPSLKHPTTMPVLPLPSPCVPYHQLTQVFHTVSLNTKRTPIRYVKMVNHSHFLLSKIILCAYQT